MPAGVAETDDFFPMARATAAGTRPPATNRALAGSVPAPILFSSPFMPNPDLSILVVDDAKFSSAMIGRALSQAGYQDIRAPARPCSSSNNARSACSWPTG